MDGLIILCMLGDPTLPAVSVPHTGGFQVDIQELLHYVKNCKCSVHIVTNTSPYCTALYEEKEGYVVHRIAVENAWLDDQNLLMKNISRIEADFFRILQHISADHLLIHSFYWLSGILALKAKQQYQINFVHSVVSLSIGKLLSGDTPHFEGQFDWEKSFLDEAMTIFSITQAEKEHLQIHYDVDPEKIMVIGRGVEPSFLHPAHGCDGLPYGFAPSASDIPPVELMKCRWWFQGAYTYVGRLQTIKGLQYILLAWLRLYKKYKDYTPPLWICGGTPKNIREFHQQLAPYMDLKLLGHFEDIQKIVWWGYLDPAGISTLFLKTRALVTHSQYEPGGRVLLEALAASVPAIATPNGFARDMIQEGENGFLVEYGDVSSLTAAMDSFLQEEHDLLRMKENAHRTYVAFRQEWQCYETQFRVYTKLGLSGFQKGRPTL